MAGMIKKVVVVGATGNAGRPIVQHLAAANFTVTAMTRSSGPTSFHIPDSVSVQQTDYTPTSLGAIFQGQDAVVSVVATDSLGEQEAIVNAAAAAGVKRFLPSEFGVDTAAPNATDVLPGLAVKQRLVEHLRAKEEEGMSWTAICVGSFFDWSLQNGLLGTKVAERKMAIYGSGDQPYENTNVDQIARGVTAVLKHPLETKNQYVYLHSFATTQNKVLAALEKVTGDKFQVAHVDVDEIYQYGLEQQKNPKGDQGVYGDGIAEMITAAIFGKGNVNNFGQKARDWMDVLGLEEEDVEESVRRAIQS